MKVSNENMRDDGKFDGITKFITMSETKRCLSVGGSRQMDAHSRHASPEALVHLATARAYFCQQSSARAYFMTGSEQTCLRAQKPLRAKAREQDSTSLSDRGPGEQTLGRCTFCVTELFNKHSSEN